MMFAESRYEDASELDIADFPGLVINSSYSAMHFAATSVLQFYSDWSPIRKNEVVEAFAKLLSTKVDKKYMKFAEDLNFVYDRRVVEDYGEIEEAEVEEAEEILLIAGEFLNFCKSIVDPDDQSPLLPNLVVK